MAILVEPLRVAIERYRLGLTDYLPVLTSQNLDFEAQSALLSAKRRLLTERISLARSLGGNWMEAELNYTITELKGK